MKIKYYSLIACLLLVAIIAIGVRVDAVDIVRNYVIENYFEASNVPVEEAGIGGVTFEDEYFQANIKSNGNTVVNQYGEWVGDDGNMVYGEVRLDLPVGNSTSSATQLIYNIPGVDDDGDRSDYIYVYDAYYVAQSSPPTTTWEILVGTTSVAFVTDDTACDASNICQLAAANEASILNTQEIAALTASSTVYSKLDYPGLDTRDGSGVQYVISVLESDYFSLYASSTDRYYTEGAGSAFDGYAVIKYFYEQGN